MCAIVASDYLLVRAYEMPAAIHKDMSQVISACSAQVSALMLRQVAASGKQLASPQNYLSLVASQTAAFYRLSCRAGAILSGASASMVNVLADFGWNVGLVMRMVRDVNDLQTDGTPP